MDTVALIVAALAGGATAGMQDTASKAVKDAYLALKALVKQRLAGRPAGEMALEQHEGKPEAWGPALKAELDGVEVGDDPEIVEAAHHLTALLESSGFEMAKYAVSVHGSQGVLIGDKGHQKNLFEYDAKAVEDD